MQLISGLSTTTYKCLTVTNIHAISCEMKSVRLGKILSEI